jgi:hypothetical protein
MYTSIEVCVWHDTGYGEARANEAVPLKPPPIVASSPPKLRTRIDCFPGSNVYSSSLLACLSYYSLRYIVLKQTLFTRFPG